MKNFLIAFVILAVAMSFYKYQKAKEEAKIEAVRNLSDEELENLCLNKYNKAACTVRGTRFIKENK